MTVKKLDPLSVEEPSIEEEERGAKWNTECQGHSDWVTDVSLNADRKLVASSSKDGTIRFWDLENVRDIPEEVQMKSPEGAGSQILKCEECGKQFPVSRLLASDQLTRCAFCRLKAPPTYHPPVM